jgi:hypothetical protein
LKMYQNSVFSKFTLTEDNSSRYCQHECQKSSFWLGKLYQKTFDKICLSKKVNTVLCFLCFMYYVLFIIYFLCIIMYYVLCILTTAWNLYKYFTRFECSFLTICKFYDFQGELLKILCHFKIHFNAIKIFG